MVNLGVTELLIVALLGLLTFVPIVVGVLALLDIAQRPESQFVAAGQSRTTWLVVAIVSFFVPCVFVAVIYYLLAVRPKLPPRGRSA